MIELASDLSELRPRIVVIGVGGAGGNAVASMMRKGVTGVEFVVANTDVQALHASCAPRLIQLGSRATEGLGAGSRAELGRMAAEESLPEIEAVLQGAHMVFIAAGFGGGTGTGAAPVIAKAAHDRGILTLGVVSKPFAFEGTRRARTAEAGLEEFEQHVDTSIVIPNQNLFRVASPATTFRAAFDLADDVLQHSVRGITDLIVTPGLINLDFADIRSIMANRGKAMMGAAEASGENRAIRAAEEAICNPLLDDALNGARGLIISISGGEDMRLMEVDEVAHYIKDHVDTEAEIIWGSAFDAALEGRIRVAVFATGIDMEQARAALPHPVVAPLSAPAPVAAAAPAGPALFRPVEIMRPVETATPAPVQFELGLAARQAVVTAEADDELLLTVERDFILTPPEGATDIPTIDPFAEDTAPAIPLPRGPSLFERIALAARGAAWDQPAPEAGPVQWPEQRIARRA